MYIQVQRNHKSSTDAWSVYGTGFYLAKHVALYRMRMVWRNDTLGCEWHVAWAQPRLLYLCSADWRWRVNNARTGRPYQPSHMHRQTQVSTPRASFASLHRLPMGVDTDGASCLERLGCLFLFPSSDSFSLWLCMYFMFIHVIHMYTYIYR